MSRPLWPQATRMQGLSLVELMISIVIGLVVTVAVVSSYLGSSGATRLAEAQARMNEDGQAALTILAQQLRMAGNNPKQPNYANATPRNPITPTFIVRGCDGSFSDITASGLDTLTCAAGGSTDSIAVRYEADVYNTVPVSGQATDCLGQALPVLTGTVNKWISPAITAANVTYTVADNRFYIGTSSFTVNGAAAVTPPGLYCKGNGNATPQRLVENVEDLQLLYGTAATTATTLAVNGYIDANDIAALVLPSDSDRWSKVVSVRICVLVRSEQPVAPDADSARYVPCFGTSNDHIAAPDLYLRRTYETTVLLRNRLLPS